MIEAGTRLLWTVYPDDHTVEVHRLNEHGTLMTDLLTAEDVLDGGEVLPGFSLLVKNIFPQKTKQEG